MVLARPGITIIGLDKIRKAVKGWSDDFNPNKRQVRVLFNRLGRPLRDDVKARITSQGEGTWPALSKWTRARTGRRKALLTERSRITFLTKPRRLEIVYLERSRDWNLTKHHRGFTTKGFSNKKVTIPLKNPRPLGTTKKALTIRQAGPSIVPARPVWTPPGKVLRIMQPIVSRWTREQLEKRAK